MLLSRVLLWELRHHLARNLWKITWDITPVALPHTPTTGWEEADGEEDVVRPPVAKEHSL